MARLFEAWVEGRTLKTAALVAAAAFALATAAGGAAEKFAESRLALPEAAAQPVASRFPANAIDYATTGSVAAAGKRELVVVSPCGVP